MIAFAEQRTRIICARLNLERHIGRPSCTASSNPLDTLICFCSRFLHDHPIFIL